MHAFANTGLAIVGFLVILGPLIFLHELGHFLVAKWMDIQVVRFSLGFPPKAFGVQWGETEYCISWLPWGGYVKMGGDTPGEPITDPRSYLAKPVWKRVPVVLAGVVMNFLTAWGVFTFLAFTGAEIETNPPIVRVRETSVSYAAGLRTGDKVITFNGQNVEHFRALWGDAVDAYERNASQPFRLVVDRSGAKVEVSYKPLVKPSERITDLGFEEYMPAVIGNVTQGFPAYEAGLQAGDKILSINGEKVEWFADIADTIHKSIDKPVELEIQRGAETKKVTLRPSAQVMDGQRMGMIGVQPIYSIRFKTSRPLVESFDAGLYGATRIAGGTIDVIANLVKRKQDVTTTLGGPISIAVTAGQALKGGLERVLELVGQLSVGLAILNALPFTPLDGGHLVFLAAEAIRRKPLPMKVQIVIQNAGFLLVMALVAVIMYSDVHKIVARTFFPQIH